MALTANSEVDHYIDQELRSFQVAAAKQVFKGALVGLATQTAWLHFTLAALGVAAPSCPPIIPSTCSTTTESAT